METKSEVRPLFSLPRPPRALYDRFGHLPIDGTMKYIWAGYDKIKQCEFPTNLIKMTFLVREKAVCSPKLHEKDFPQNHDFLYHVSIASVGTTSYSVSHDLFESTTMERLTRTESKMVNIDPETRKPSKLPAEFLDRCSSFKCNDSVLITEVQGDIIPPQNAFKTTIRTRYSDTDVNFHINFGAYYGFCADCASEASQSGYYRHYDDDISQFPVLETDATFIGESAPCSNLDVYTWQDTKNVQDIYFAIYLKSARIFQARYRYGLE
ncbi:hypothetical protein KP79_PYT04892 [Mizuhopecten yessoensis]|uniref:Uncharacterized protein n=1 Tax=Mizuhopecten yessoensis TaxID=6573 RepID=A0A210PGQ9_MIZYE|nr:hypothetical protein KP79_PYT04892 [Mizuhopecten yessoensis]